MSNLTTSVEIDAGVVLFYDKMLLVRAKPFLIHDQFAQLRPLPAGNSKTIKFRRYTNLTTATTAISEGVTPDGQQLVKEDLLAVVEQYGDFIHITDVVDVINTSSEVLRTSMDLLSQQMAETYDEIVRNVLTTCSSTTSSSEAGNVISDDEIDAVTFNLMEDSARFITELQSATDNVGTLPVRQSYWGTTHTRLLTDIQNLASFQSIANYPGGDSDRRAESEWGATTNVRWVHSPFAINNVEENDAFTTESNGWYWLNIFGKDAYATIDLKELNAKSIIQPYGSGGTEDPLKQRMSMGWKFATTARVLNDTFMHILKVKKAV